MTDRLRPVPPQLRTEDFAALTDKLDLLGERGGWLVGWKIRRTLGEPPTDRPTLLEKLQIGVLDALCLPSDPTPCAIAESPSLTHLHKLITTFKARTGGRPARPSSRALTAPTVDSATEVPADEAASALLLRDA